MANTTHLNSDTFFSTSFLAAEPLVSLLHFMKEILQCANIPAMSLLLFLKVLCLSFSYQQVKTEEYKHCLFSSVPLR